MTEQATTFQPDWVSPPGESIADLLEEKGWSQAEFSQRCGYTTKHVSQLINGKATITEDTAIKLIPLYSGSLGEPGSGAETYILLIRFDTEAIVDALK